MRTVVMLSWEYPPYLVGGLSRHVHALSQELVAQGCTVHVLTRAMSDLPRREVESGVQVTRVQPYFQEPNDFRLWVSHLNFALMEAGAELLQNVGRPVILHAHDWLVAYAAKGLKGLFKLPLVATIHATEHGRHGGLHDPGQAYINDIEWWLTYEAWRVIVCSEAMRREVQLLFGLSEDKVAVISNGITWPLPSPIKAPRQTFAAPEERLIVHVGRLVPEKGAAVLLEALSLLSERFPCRLVIGGSGPYREELQARAVALGLQDRVQFAGWLSDEAMQVLYHHADVVVVPSTYEPFGIVALEAMSAGAPLVVSDVGGLSEIVIHGVNGLKAPPANAVLLAEQMGRLLADRGLASRIATEAKRYVQERYGWSGVARRTIELYNEVDQAYCATAWGEPPALLPPRVTPDAVPGRYMG